MARKNDSRQLSFYRPRTSHDGKVLISQVSVCSQGEGYPKVPTPPQGTYPLPQPGPDGGRGYPKEPTPPPTKVPNSPCQVPKGEGVPQGTYSSPTQPRYIPPWQRYLPPPPGQVLVPLPEGRYLEVPLPPVNRQTSVKTVPYRLTMYAVGKNPNVKFGIIFHIYVKCKIGNIVPAYVIEHFCNCFEFFHYLSFITRGITELATDALPFLVIENAVPLLPLSRYPLWLTTVNRYHPRLHLGMSLLSDMECLW